MEILMAIDNGFADASDLKEIAKRPSNLHQILVSAACGWGFSEDKSF